MSQPHDPSDGADLERLSSVHVPRLSSTGRRMPGDLDIALRVGSGVVMPDVQPGKRRQSLQGFEETYTDIVDYIVRITHRIWEDQDVGYIYDTYAPGCRVFDDHGPRYGVEEMVAGTIASISAFPAIRMYADEVIWAGDDEQGFVTSHRALNIGDHTGRWRWGQPTHRRINMWVIANCVVRSNLIEEEWVLYNTGARLQQLGLDVPACARELGNSAAWTAPGNREITEVQRLHGGRKPVSIPEPAWSASEPYPVEDAMKALFHNLFNRRDLSTVDRFYATNVRWYGTTNRLGYGRSHVRAMARGLLSTFPDLGVSVDEVYWMGNETDGLRATVRWSGSGTHKGYTMYGAPTGRQVHLWGISQIYLWQGEIVEEWSLFNEFDVLTQLLRDEFEPWFA